MSKAKTNSRKIAIFYVDTLTEFGYISNMSKYLLVNFGGPRDLSEIPSFLTSLLSDRDVIRTWFPTFFHNWFFGRIARKRSLKVKLDYEEIGGRSPIYFDTEALAAALRV